MDDFYQILDTDATVRALWQTGTLKAADTEEILKRIVVVLVKEKRELVKAAVERARVEAPKPFRFEDLYEDGYDPYNGMPRS